MVHLEEIGQESRLQRMPRTGRWSVMATLTLKVPESLREQAQDLADERGYQSVSEYVRSAMRDKIEKDIVTVRAQNDEEMITLEDARRTVENTGSNHSPENPAEGSKRDERGKKASNPQ